MSGTEIKRSFEMKRLFDRLLEEADSSLDHRDKLASATAEMDKKFGHRWRQYSSPFGVPMIDTEEGGVVKKDPKNCLFNDVSKAMLKKNMENGALLDLVEPEEDEEDTQKSLQQMVEIRIMTGDLDG